MTIRLYDNDSGATLGTVSEEQLQFLVDQLEEETSKDRDYYLQAETLELLEGRGADAALIGLLRRALGDRDGVEIRWEREE